MPEQPTAYRVVRKVLSSLLMDRRRTWSRQSFGFHAPYNGPNSLTPAQDRETTDVTAYLGARPWHGGEIWANPELDQGFGLNDTLGAAGFPSGEAYKVGKSKPYFRLPRLFLRHALDLRATASTSKLLQTNSPPNAASIVSSSRSANSGSRTFLMSTSMRTIRAATFSIGLRSTLEPSTMRLTRGYTVGAAAEWYQGPLDTSPRPVRPVRCAEQRPPGTGIPRIPG